MQEHFRFTTDQAKIQKQYAAIFFFVSTQLPSIQMYLQRRNCHLVKQEDAVIIAIHLLMKMKKHPPKAGVSVASVKGNAGPTAEHDGGGKKTSQNQQYGKENMGNE